MKPNWTMLVATALLPLGFCSGQSEIEQAQTVSAQTGRPILVIAGRDA